MVKESGHEFPLYPQLPLVDRLNSLDEIGAAFIIRDVSFGPGLQGLENHGFIHNGSYHEHLGLWAFLSDRRDYFYAIHLGHYDIEEDDIGLKVVDDIDCLEPIDGLAHDLDVVFAVEDQAEPFPKYPVIAGNQNLDRSSRNHLLDASKELIMRPLHVELALKLH